MMMLLKALRIYLYKTAPAIILKHTINQNINKRANEYLKDERIEIKRMFRKWKEYLYYRYYPDTDNEKIRSNEVKLIRAKGPEYHEEIPDNIEIQDSVPAF